MIWDHEPRMLLCALFTAALCVSYLFLDGRRLLRAFKSGDHDEKFGYVISMAIVAIGFAGIVNHYWI